MVLLRICRILEFKFSFDIRIYFYNYPTGVSIIFVQYAPFYLFLYILFAMIKEVEAISLEEIYRLQSCVL